MANSPEHGGPNEEQPFKSSYEGLFDQDTSSSQEEAHEDSAALEPSATEPAAPAPEKNIGDYMPMTSDGEIDWAQYHRRIEGLTLVNLSQIKEGYRDQPPKTPEGSVLPETKKRKAPRPGNAAQSEQPDQRPEA